MEKYGWIMGIMVMVIILATTTGSAWAQCGGGQMNHGMMNNNTGYYGYSGTCSPADGPACGYVQTDPGYTDNYGYANPYVASPPAVTYVPIPPEQTTGYQNYSGHDHNH